MPAEPGHAARLARTGASRAVAFAPGRVNLIGEHTDYNQGLALPFAITQGITVRAQATGDTRIYAQALDLGEEDEFSLAQPLPAQGWRAFVRGAVAELQRAGFPLVGARLQLSGDLPQGAGLSSSAALEVSLCLALLALAGATGAGDAPDAPVGSGAGTTKIGVDRIEVARLCSRIENDWVGARTGLLDQLASLCGEPDTALCIDFQTLTLEPVPLRLRGGWRLVTLDSGERHALASSAYNERRAECSRACDLLGVRSLREASWGAVARLPEPLRRRAGHVLGENARVRETVAALRAEDLPAVGGLLNSSHASLRDCFEVSSAAVEDTVLRLLDAGAAGARLIGGGFGGHVLGLLAPDVLAPAGARLVRAGPGARLLPR